MASCIVTDQHNDRGHMSDWLIGLTPHSDPLTGPVGPLLFRHLAGYEAPGSSKSCPCQRGVVAVVKLNEAQHTKRHRHALARGACANRGRT